MLAARIALLGGVARCRRQVAMSGCSSLALNCKAARPPALVYRCQSTLTSRADARPADAHRAAKPSESRPTYTRRRRRFLKYIREPPNSTLALALRVRQGASPLTWETWSRLRDIAQSRSLRLPVVAAQMLIRKDEEQLRTSMSEVLCEPAEWRARLNSLAFKGVAEDEIHRWLWILSAEDADERVARFASSPGAKPIFVLMQLLQKHSTIRKAGSLRALSGYIIRYHIRPRSIPPDSQLPFGAVRRSLDPGLNMTPMHFARLLRLLVHQYLRVWPGGLTSLARLVAMYIETIPSKTAESQRAFAQSCFIFNYALTLFQRKAPLNPVLNMVHSWRAQRILLAMADAAPRPLQIDRAGFTAIRRVMVALGKSPAEKKVAAQMVRTWPPFRKEWNGLDERRRLEDDLSVSVKSGTLMRESGYADNEHHRALGILGGAIPGEFPTVQTRSLAPRVWDGKNASLNVFSTWAARVRATRDANEAWRQFQSAPAENLRPNFQVYAEMFDKLFAAPTDPSRPGLPGDAKEVLPVRDIGLSDFEKQRVRPPTISELYGQMIREGNRPVGHCLRVLIRNASSMDALLQYLDDSALDREAVSVLKSPTASLEGGAGPAVKALRHVPLGIFNAYISRLCGFQPRRTAVSIHSSRNKSIGRIHEAIRLSSTRLPQDTAEGRTYKAPWHNILRSLAKPRILVRAYHMEDQRFQDFEALSVFMGVFAKVRDTMGLDPVVFNSLRQVTLKALRWDKPSGLEARVPGREDAHGAVPGRTSPISQAGDGRETCEADLLRAAHSALVSAFWDMTQAVPSGPSEDIADDVAGHPTLPHRIEAFHLKGYLNVLGYLGDLEEMVRVMRWLLQTWEDGTILEDSKDPDHSDHAVMVQTFILFRAFAENRVEAGVMRQLEQQLDQLREEQACFWPWPSKEDADEFVRHELWQRPYTEDFWARVRPI